GSIKINVKTTIDVTLTDSNVQKIPSNARGPLFHRISAIGGLLLGRSSAGIKGLIVLPGVIDTDYMGQIYIMAYTICPPLFIPKGSRIAQIVAFISLLGYPPRTDVHRGNRSFGSTGPAICFTTKMDQRPTMTVILSQHGMTKQILAMLDTGTDVTIIS
ncbi:hypothetical protein N329_11308, partial [Haliaeetus albicilla]